MILRGNTVSRFSSRWERRTFFRDNPSEIALKEARKLWPSWVKFGLVSIGTGRPKVNSIRLREGAEADPEVQKSFLKDLKWNVPNFAKSAWNVATNSTSGVKALMKMAVALAQIVMNSEEVHQRLYNQSRLKETQFLYFRFSVPRDVGDIGLEEWSRSDELGTYTDNYMLEAEVEEQRDCCLKFLLSAFSSCK